MAHSVFSCAFLYALCALRFALFQQPLFYTFQRGGDPDFDLCVEMFFGNVDNTDPIRLVEKHDRAGGLERTH